MNDDKLRGIYAKLSAEQVKALAPADPPVAHGGTSFDDAIMNLASDEPSGAQNEANFLLHFSCPADDGKRGRWREDTQRLVEQDGKKCSARCNRAEVHAARSPWPRAMRALDPAMVAILERPVRLRPRRMKRRR